MKIEICNNTHNVLVTALVAVAVVALASVIAAGINANQKQAFDAGYQGVYLPGSVTDSWQKIPTK